MNLSRGRNNTASTPASSNSPCAKAAPSSGVKTASSSPRRTTASCAPTAASTSPTSTEALTRLLLPEDPDRSAANLRRALKKRTGLRYPVIITDSFGRPWREGLTEFAIGISGLKPLRDDRGRRDPHGYELKASVEAVADELACAAGLVCGKLNRAPACIVRGFRYDPGEGSVRDLLRPAATDLFR